MQRNKAWVRDFLLNAAVVWVVFWGLLILLALAFAGATFERDADIALPTMLLGPPAFLLCLAWLFSPQRK